MTNRTEHLPTTHVIAPGENVNLGPGHRTGRVLAFSFGIGGHVQYQVSYWSNHRRRTSWIQSCELRPRDDTKCIEVQVVEHDWGIAAQRPKITEEPWTDDRV